MKVSVVNSRINCEQKLVDLCFQIALMISTPGKDRGDIPYDLTKLSTPEKAAWVADQLRACGFDTKPVGSSWGVLKWD